jgi:hypothetical protein
VKETVGDPHSGALRVQYGGYLASTRQLMQALLERTSGASRAQLKAGAHFMGRTLLAKRTGAAIHG